MNSDKPKKKRGIIGSPQSYGGIHDRLRQENGLAPVCIWDDNHLGNYEWANVTGIYTTNIEDYLPMCRSCHRKFDITENMKLLARERTLKNNPAIKLKVRRTGLEDSSTDVFSSITEASKKTGILQTSIVNNLKGRSMSAGGYTRRYYNE